MTPTVVTRTFASTPKYFATETWNQIIQLLAPDERSSARADLLAVSGIVCSCMTDQALRDDPLTVYGAGPRLRIYCVYDDDALEGDSISDGPLTFIPTDGDWSMSVPCLASDLVWIQRALASLSPRVNARAVGEEVGENSGDSGRDTSRRSPRAFAVDLDAFQRS